MESYVPWGSWNKNEHVGNAVRKNRRYRAVKPKNWLNFRWLFTLFATVFIFALLVVWWNWRPHPVIGQWESGYFNAAFYKDGTARLMYIKGSWRPNGQNAVIVEGVMEGEAVIGDFLLKEKDGVWTGTTKGLPFNFTLKKIQESTETAE